MHAGEQAGLTGQAGLAVGFALPVLLCYLFLFRPIRFALGVGALLLVGHIRPGVYGSVLHAERSFFGVHRITLDPSGRFVQLVHGSTVHGKQRLVSPANKPPDAGGRATLDGEPLSYYHRSGPIGQVFGLPALNGGRHPVAVVGLGTGSLAAYAAPGQQFDFYEIDPAVARIAEYSGYFTYLTECRGRYRIRLGDARVTLANAPDRRYGLMVIDAFTSDAVPVHLITREALELYRSKLAPGGLLAFNISNRYLDLGPVLGDLAGQLGMVCLARYELAVIPALAEEGKSPSMWVVLASRTTDVRALEDSLLWTRLPARPGRLPWTDDLANVLGAWKWE